MSAPTENDVWHLALCRDCTPHLPQPFRDETQRDEWATAHRNGTGHRVERVVEVDGVMVLLDAPGV